MSRKVLIACERSGRVREEFNKRGYDAVSCDIEPSTLRGKHIQDDVLNHLIGFYLIIAFVPCTHLAVSGARWFKDKRTDGRQQVAIDFFLKVINAPAKMICVENPVGIMSTVYRKPDQIIHPWQFGHGETKKTCLWLKGLPLLIPTKIVSGREARIHKMPPSRDRGYLRSITYKGVGEAMAEQWGKLLGEQT